MDWPAFLKLPGDPRRNFEIVARAAVTEAYGRFGTLRGTRQQPGVEFYLVLDGTSPLGAPPRVFGWQCKFYDDDKGYLDQKRRARIEDGLKKAIEHVPGLTDFVLWTRLPLREQDDAWLQALPYGVARHSWHAEDLDRLLTEHAPGIKAAYFGGSALTPHQLQLRYEDALEHIVDRYEAPLHVESTELWRPRRSLGESDQWSSPLRHGEREGTTEQVLGRLPRYGWLGADDVRVITASVRARHAVGDDAPHAVAAGQLLELRDAIDALPPVLGPVPLIAARDAAMAAGEEKHANDLAWLEDIEITADARLSQAAQDLRRSLIALVGGAGVGKTHLAAALTASSQGRGTGVLVLARRFGALLDGAQLAQALHPGTTNLEDALDALQGAAARSGRRLPLVIDGLNESDDPFRWRGVLIDLHQHVRRRPHLLLVVTVRPDYAERCLPPKTEQIELTGFSRGEREEAVQRYFEAYKIEAEVSELPWLAFDHPLFLRIFCEATNPERAEVVRVAEVPDGRSAVFERFIDNALARIGERQPSRDLTDARARVSRIAESMWTTSRRSLSQARVKELCGDAPTEWEGTLTQQLITEGVLRRDPPPPGVADPARQEIAFSFDLIAGHVIAAVLATAPGAVLADAGLAERLLVGRPQAHPLAQDVVAGLEAYLAWTGSPPLWQRTPSAELRAEALIRTTELPPSQIGPAGAQALRALIAAEPRHLGRVMPRVLSVHDRSGHPLNAEWLDDVLGSMAIWERDLHWSEWVRTHRDHVLELLDEIADRLGEEGRPENDHRLTAVLVAWLLTSTDRVLRDRATYVLWAIGMRDPRVLFDLTVERLSADDPYVVERCVAAAYGVFMGNAFADDLFLAAAPSFLERVHAAVVAQTAPHPSAHWLVRAHIEGIAAFARAHRADILPVGWRDAAAVLPLPGVTADPIDRGHPAWKDAVGMLSMDFDNSTIGVLTADRNNHDGAHPEHRARVAEVLGRAWELGWRPARFDAIDRDIARSSRDDEYEPERVERYGAKYAWIAFYEVAGRRGAAGDGGATLARTANGFSEVPIDPSFPRPPLELADPLPNWTAEVEETSDERWIRGGAVAIPKALIGSPPNGAGDRFVCAYGYLSTGGGGDLSRRVYAFFRLLLVPRGTWRRLEADLKRRPWIDRFALPEAGSDAYTYGGEIPWAAHFADGAHGQSDVTLDSGESITAEVVAHDFGWESYHSSCNRAGGQVVPSQSFSLASGLRAGPGSVDQFSSDERLASTFLSAPRGSEGGLLYIREDLLRTYAAARGMEMGLVVWGERLLMLGGLREYPEWYTDAVRARANTHRTVLPFDQLVQ